MLKSILISSILVTSPVMLQFTNNENINTQKNVSISQYHISEWSTKISEHKVSAWSEPRLMFNWKEYATNWSDFLDKYKSIFLDSSDIFHIYVLGVNYQLTNSIATQFINTSTGWTRATFYVEKSKTAVFASQSASCSISVSRDSQYIYFQNKWEFDTNLSASAVGISVSLNNLILSSESII